MSKETCRIIASETIIPDVGLGKYINGYDSRYDTLPWEKLVLLSAFAVFFFYTGIQGLVQAPKDKNLGPFVSYLLSFLPILIGGIFAAYTIKTLNKYYLKRSVVYVYENGFAWKKTKRNGETIKSGKINFNKVDGIDFPQTRCRINGIYIRTTYEFNVWSNDRLLFHKSGSYRNLHEEKEEDWELLSLKAIMDRWNYVGLARINEDLFRNGFVSFYDNGTNKRIEVGRYYIKVGSNTYQKEHIKYRFYDGILYIDDDTNDSDWLSSYDVKININRMTNSHLFLCTINSLLEIS